MAPHEGLTHLKQYDIKDSNLEFIGTDIDHRVKYNSAATEPAWNNGRIGVTEGLYIWRIEDFEVVPWPSNRIGQFYDGDSYIVLQSYKVGDSKPKLHHEIFFWLGSKTSQDEAGVAAYKTVELDDFLHGVATQRRETQEAPSPTFLALFPRLKILSGGVRSGFRHMEQDEQNAEVTTLLRVFKTPSGQMVVHEVEPIWQSLDDDGVFVLDKGDKIWVWQGKKCSPMEKARAANVVSDMTLAKHIDVEVLSQTEARSKVVVEMLGGKDVYQDTFHSSRPGASSRVSTSSHTNRLFRLSDATGILSFDLVKDGTSLQTSDLDGSDVFLLDNGSSIWVWRGLGASKAERGSWLKVAQSYIRQLRGDEGGEHAYHFPLASVVEGNESPAFLKALQI